MRLVIQRVSKASVSVDDSIVGAIDRGYVVLLGIGRDDTPEIIDKYADKLLKLRIFADENGKTNLSLSDIAGELLVISQFTLYADCRSNRPGFSRAGGAALAEELYEHFMDYCRPKVKKLEHGVFGANMKVSLINDGPFTICLDSEDR